MSDYLARMQIFLCLLFLQICVLFVYRFSSLKFSHTVIGSEIHAYKKAIHAKNC